jgi:hypothetical protein
MADPLTNEQVEALMDCSRRSDGYLGSDIVDADGDNVRPCDIDAIATELASARIRITELEEQRERASYCHGVEFEKHHAAVAALAEARTRIQELEALVADLVTDDLLPRWIQDRIKAVLK